MGYKDLQILFWPQKSNTVISNSVPADKFVAVIVPTYNPSKYTYRLIESLTKFHPEMHIVVVDDCTPLHNQSNPVFSQIQQFVSQQKNIYFLRTPRNFLKAGAINYGISYLKKANLNLKVVAAFDDDVVINKNTLPRMIAELYSDAALGAVCSLATVKNKNVNMLTRLQAMEYQGFNITKIADNTVFKGPLVMQGMLTAFRWTALASVKGYTKNHLIEDYDITVRLKLGGWKVRIAQSAKAATYVPETMEHLWRQRVRWGVGGLHVVAQYWRNLTAVFQDMLGHTLFLMLFGLVLVSFLVREGSTVDTRVLALVLGVALINFIIGFGFSLYQLRIMANRDRTDILMRVSLVPELIYSMILSAVLVGAYAYLSTQALTGRLARIFKPANVANSLTQSLFAKMGYSTTWGTRAG